MLVANCRTRFTPEDLEFLVEALAGGERDHDPLRALTTDPEAIDRLLDDPRLFARLLAAPRLLEISPWFFYYVVVRRAFLDHGIEPVRVADYVGALLGYHLQSRGTGPRRGGGPYLVDLVLATNEARTAEDAFALQAEIGDVALYLTGVFPDWIWHGRVYGRRLVDLEYYESMGSRFYGVAARSEAAGRLDLGDVLAFMSENFPALRRALNDLVDEHLVLAPRPADVESLLRRAVGRATN